MWSEYGLRSLAKNDAFFGVDEDYWRGNIWVNLNYLVLRALHEKYGKEGIASERCMRIYNALRDNLVKNVMAQVVLNAVVVSDSTRRRASTGRTTIPTRARAEACTPSTAGRRSSCSS